MLPIDLNKNKNAVIKKNCIEILNRIIEDLSDRPGLLFPWNLYLNGLKTVRDYLSSLE